MKTLLKSCQYCGKIHEAKIDCGKKPKQVRKKTASKMDKFRWTRAWQEKREQIKERDKYMCVVCKTGKYFTDKKYNTKDLSVHHIVPLLYDFDKRLDDDNLITLCSYHHELAECGKVPASELKEMIKSNEDSVMVL